MQNFAPGTLIKTRMRIGCWENNNPNNKRPLLVQIPEGECLLVLEMKRDHYMKFLWENQIHIFMDPQEYGTFCFVKIG